MEPVRLRVECYAGYRDEETPRVLVIGERRIAVVEILDRWLAPDHRYFKVRAADSDTYIIRHDGASDIWELTLFERSASCASSISAPAVSARAREDRT
jgi:hypothetical protein